MEDRVANRMGWRSCRVNKTLVLLFLLIHQCKWYTVDMDGYLVVHPITTAVDALMKSGKSCHLGTVCLLTLGLY